VADWCIELAAAFGRGKHAAFGKSTKYEELSTSAPSKAVIGKLDNPARLKINHQAGTEPGV